MMLMMMMIKMMVMLMMIIISPVSLAENKSELFNLKTLNEIFPTLFIGSLAAFNSGHARGSYLQGKVVEIKSELFNSWTLSMKSSHGLMIYIGSGILLLEVLLEVSLSPIQSLNVQKI